MSQPTFNDGDVLYADDLNSLITYVDDVKGDTQQIVTDIEDMKDDIATDIADATTAATAAAESARDDAQQAKDDAQQAAADATAPTEEKVEQVLSESYEIFTDPEDIYEGTGSAFTPVSALTYVTLGPTFSDGEYDHRQCSINLGLDITGSIPEGSQDFAIGGLKSKFKPLKLTALTGSSVEGASGTGAAHGLYLATGGNLVISYSSTEDPEMMLITGTYLVSA